MALHADYLANDSHHSATKALFSPTISQQNMDRSGLLIAESLSNNITLKSMTMLS
jgi:hypothetical protein